MEVTTPLAIRRKLQLESQGYEWNKTLSRNTFQQAENIINAQNSFRRTFTKRIPGWAESLATTLEILLTKYPNLDSEYATYIEDFIRDFLLKAYLKRQTLTEEQKRGFDAEWVPLLDIFNQQFLDEDHLPTENELIANASALENTNFLGLRLGREGWESIEEPIETEVPPLVEPEPRGEKRKAPKQAKPPKPPKKPKKVSAEQKVDNTLVLLEILEESENLKNVPQLDKFIALWKVLLRSRLTPEVEQAAQILDEIYFDILTLNEFETPPLDFEERVRDIILSRKQRLDPLQLTIQQQRRADGIPIAPEEPYLAPSQEGELPEEVPVPPPPSPLEGHDEQLEIMRQKINQGKYKIVNLDFTMGEVVVPLTWQFNANVNRPRFYKIVRSDSSTNAPILIHIQKKKYTSHFSTLLRPPLDI